MSTGAAGAYVGTDNLEVMEEALNYNAFFAVSGDRASAAE